MEWYKIKLSSDELKEIESAEQQVDKPQLLKRLQCIKLKNEQWKHKDIAKFLSVELVTVSNWIKIYKEKGVEGLLQWGYKGRVSVLTLEQQEELKARDDEKPFSTAKEVVFYIKKHFQIDFHLHYVQKLLKKNFNFRTRSLN